MPADMVVAGVYTCEGDDETPSRPQDEYVVLVNVGTECVDLRGWSLTNRKDDGVHHYRYLFPRFLSNGDIWEVKPGGLVLIYTGRGTNGATATVGEAPQIHLYEHRTQHIWADAGDTVCLFDREDSLVSMYQLPLVRRTA